MNLLIKNKKLRKFTFLLVLISCITVCSYTPTYALTSSKKISVRAYDNHDSAYSKYKDVKRTKKYNYVSTKLIGVTPKENINRPDDFSKIRCKIFRNDNGKYSAISNQVTLEEGKGWKNITIKNGYLDINYPYFGYIGNSPNYAADAKVGMDAR